MPSFRQRLAAPVTLVLMALALAGCAPDPDSLMERARAGFAAHDFKAAQLDLASVLKARPGDPAALELHARTALALGDGEGAAASLARMPAARRPSDFALLAGEAELLRERPGDARKAVASVSSAEAWRIRALAALAEDDEASAAAAFASGEKAGGAKDRLLADYARFRLHAGDVTGARALADQSLRASKGSLDAMLIDAQVTLASGDLAGALDRFGAAATVWPGNLAALTGKAGVLGDLGRLDEMEYVLKKAGAAGASDGQLAWLEARLAAARKDWPKARAVLQANDTLLSRRADAQLLHAEALVALGQPEQARARLQPLLTAAPGNLAVRRALARAALAARDPAGAVEVLRPLAANPLTATEDLRLLADAARQARDPMADVLARRAAVPPVQDMARILADADSAMKAGNWGNAIAAYDRIMAITDGKSALVLNNLAVSHDKVGNRAKALGYAMRALRQAPANPSVMDTAAWLMLRTGGDRPRALALLREAATKAPGNAAIAAHLRAAEAGTVPAG